MEPQPEGSKYHAELPDDRPACTHSHRTAPPRPGLQSTASQTMAAMTTAARITASPYWNGVQGRACLKALCGTAPGSPAECL